MRAVLGHALRYSTWASLAGEGLGDDDVARLVVTWLYGVAGASPRAPPSADD